MTRPISKLHDLFTPACKKFAPDRLNESARHEISEEQGYSHGFESLNRANGNESGRTPDCGLLEFEATTYWNGR